MTGGRCLAALIAFLCFLVSPAVAVEPEGAEASAMAELREALTRTAEIDAERRRTREELDELGAEIVLTEETAESLDAEIEALAQDREAVRLAMIEAADAQKRASAEIAASEREIEGLSLREGDLQRSLRDRRGTLAEVLGALERMGRKPPPALLVHPDDALGSVRSAILLGSVVPAIRAETDALVADLDELASLRGAIEGQKQVFAAGLSRQREEEARLMRLFAEKERLEADRQETLVAMNRRTAELAGRAGTLQELIGALESDLSAAEAAEESARSIAAERAVEAEERRLAALAEESERRERLAAEAQREEAERLAALAPPPEPERPVYDIASLRRDMEALDVAAPFSTMKGTLTRPVVGEARIIFGEDDGFGRRADGTTFAARAGDLVTAPADGRILYSGPFRSYGQLLILNAGDGYHIVLAGMREIDVEVGQFVLAGEPVAVMGARRLASVGDSDLPSTEPSLYVEFRKDGKPVDPDPWWTDGSSGRTRNDS